MRSVPDRPAYTDQAVDAVLAAAHGEHDLAGWVARVRARLPPSSDHRSTWWPGGRARGRPPTCWPWCTARPALRRGPLGVPPMSTRATRRTHATALLRPPRITGRTKVVGLAVNGERSESRQ